MKDTLGKFVSQNREAFDDQEPPESVWRSIDALLPLQRQRFLGSPMVRWRAAAVLFFVVSVYLFVTHNTGITHRGETARLQKDFTDLDSFYSSQITEKMRLINDYDEVGENEQFTQDFQKLDAMYQVLREEMKNNPSEEVKDALILNLLVRVDLLNQQLKKLEDSRKGWKIKKWEDSKI